MSLTKPEPLTKNDTVILLEGCFVRYNDVKSAVQWLLEEIQKLKEKYVDGDVCLPTDEVIKLIKKAFGGIEWK